MPSRHLIFVRPRVLAVVGSLITLSTLFTYRGSCAPVGDYTGPSGIHNFIVRWKAIGAAYGNGCEAYISTLPLVIGLTLLIVGAFSKWNKR